MAFCLSLLVNFATSMSSPRQLLQMTSIPLYRHLIQQSSCLIRNEYRPVCQKCGCTNELRSTCARRNLSILSTVEGTDSRAASSFASESFLEPPPGSGPVDGKEKSRRKHGKQHRVLCVSHARTLNCTLQHSCTHIRGTVHSGITVYGSQYIPKVIMHRSDMAFSC